MMRHAEVLDKKSIYGRSNIGIKKLDNDKKNRFQKYFSKIENIHTSPAKRCLQTFKEIWPATKFPKKDKRLWEQDFGDWEGKLFSELPDLGILDNEDLANFLPPNGESFKNVCDRVKPAIIEISKIALNAPVLVICHAGTIRATIALALENYSVPLKFEINNLSLTRIRVLSDTQYSIISTNELV
jgi:alpha-ribazole phosphatase